MLNFPKSLSSKTTQNLIKISTGKVLNAAFAFAVGILIARNLGAGDFGLFTLSLSVLIITLEIIGSEGIDNGVVRFASVYVGNDINRANLIFKIAFKFKLLMVSIVLFLVLIFFNPFLTFITVKPELKNAVMFGLIGGCCASFWRYVLAVLQSYERFTAYALINIIPNITKTILILFFIFNHSLNLINALTINVLAIFFGFIVGFLFIPKQFILAKGNERNLTSQWFHFSKWIIISSLLFALYSRVDILMLSYYKTTDIVGLYSVALSFITALDLIYISMLTGFLPQVSKLKHQHEFITHIKQSLKISLVLTLFFIPLFLIAEPMIVLTYSKDFFDSILIFKILLIGSLFTLLFNPLLLILYARNKPYILAFVYILLLALNFGGSLLYIPKYGAIGAASVVSATRAIGGVLLLFLAFRETYYANN